ncbi:MAG: hypothetical protein B7X28_02075, partial [Halothiobacillus sp. 13-55-253]
MFGRIGHFSNWTNGVCPPRWPAFRPTISLQRGSAGAIRFLIGPEWRDWVRIDHFRGLAAYWSIPAQCDTAIDGRWVEAPGAALLTALSEAFGGDLPIIAEDLGVITEDVTALRKAFGMPGMLILQFAFDSDDDNPYLPANHHADSVVYTGTHDNDTTLGWWQSLSPDAQAHMYDVLAQQLNLSSSEPMPMALLRAAMASVAQLA